MYIFESCCIVTGLRNDHKALMKKIEEGLHKIHALAGGNKTQEPVPNVSDIQETETLEPFLRVNLVSPGSPAEIAVCYCIFYILAHVYLTHDLVFLTEFIITI